MKRLMIAIGLLICPALYPMDTANDIASKIGAIIEQYDSTTRADDDDFRSLVTSYFSRESRELEAHVLPLFAQKIKDRDADIGIFIQQQDKEKLEAFISGLITESLEDAFKNQSDRFQELKSLADEKLQKTRYALIGTVITAVLSIGGVLGGLYLKLH